MELYMFNCKCGEKAEWLVWYKDCGGLYNYRCTKHAILDLQGKSLGTGAYPVVCIRPVPNKTELSEIDILKKQLEIATRTLEGIVGPSISSNTPKEILKIHDVVWEAQQEIRKIGSLNRR